MSEDEEERELVGAVWEVDERKYEKFGERLGWVDYAACVFGVLHEVCRVNLFVKVVYKDKVVECFLDIVFSRCSWTFDDEVSLPLLFYRSRSKFR